MTLDELKTQRRWLLWRYVTLPGSQRAKVPFQLSGGKAQSNNPATWSTYAECEAVVSRYAGVGITTGNGVTSVDLDDVIVDGVILPAAMALVTALDSYTETTPSGAGLLVLASGELPGGGIGFVCSGFSGEMRAKGFFHSFTGDHLEGTPLDLMARQVEIEALYERFRPQIKQSVSDGIPHPLAVGRIVRRFVAYCDARNVDTSVRTLADGRVFILTSPCLTVDLHTEGGETGGVGVMPSGALFVNCFHTHCKAQPWAEWRRVVEEKHGLMGLERTIVWK